MEKFIAHPSNYAKYLSEVTNRHIIEDEHGFITYEFMHESCYIVDIFVKKESRGQGRAKKFALTVLEIAKSKGCNSLFGTVQFSSKTKSQSLAAFLAMGMELHMANQETVYLVKEI